MITEKEKLETVDENEIIIIGENLRVRKAKKKDPEYFNKVCAEAREFLSEVKSSLSDDIIADRNNC